MWVIELKLLNSSDGWVTVLREFEVVRRRSVDTLIPLHSASNNF